MQQRPRPNRHQRGLTAAMAEFVRGISANTATRLLLGLPVEEDGSEESGAERRRVTAR